MISNCLLYNRIIEIGIIRVEGNVVVDEFSTLVNPNCNNVLFDYSFIKKEFLRTTAKEYSLCLKLLGLEIFNLT